MCTQLFVVCRYDCWLCIYLLHLHYSECIKTDRYLKPCPANVYLWIYYAAISASPTYPIADARNNMFIVPLISEAKWRDFLISSSSRFNAISSRFPFLGCEINLSEKQVRCQMIWNTWSVVSSLKSMLSLKNTSILINQRKLSMTATKPLSQIRMQINMNCIFAVCCNLLDLMHRR